MFREWIHALLWVKRHLMGQLRVPELRCLSHFISETDVCVDVGAHAGSWLLPLAKLAKRGHAYGFEAFPYYAEVLRLTVRLIGSRNITVVNQAVADKPGKLQLVWKAANGGRLTGLTHIAGLSDSRNGCIEVSSGPLDDYFANTRGRISFIKCDVEGAELGVFRGAMFLLGRFRPVVYTELVDSYLARYGHSKAQVFELFRQLAYQAFRFELGGTLLPVSKPREFSGNDVVFLPAELVSGTK